MPNFVTRIAEGITNGSATVLHYASNLLLPHISLENFANKIEAAGDAAGNLANLIETSASTALATPGNPVVIGVGGLVITISVGTIVYCGYKLWEYCTKPHFNNQTLKPKVTPEPEVTPGQLVDSTEVHWKLDAPQTNSIVLQDPATASMEAIHILNDHILFIMIQIVFFVFWLVAVVLTHYQQWVLSDTDEGVADIPFYPSFFYKDAQAVAVYLIVFGTYVLFPPNVLNHPDNYIPANAYETLAHVVPEWYFLSFYVMLRLIPYKTLGVSTMVCSILVLFSILFTYYAPWRNTEFRPVFKPFFWLFISNFIILSWLGQQNVSNYI